MSKPIVRSIPIFSILALLEIAFFIIVVSLIGFSPAFFLTLLTTSIGLILLAQKGKRVFDAHNSPENSQNDPRSPLKTILTLLSALLLILPGFITDAIGLALLITPIRQKLFSSIYRWFTPSSGASHTQSHTTQSSYHSNKDEIQEAEFREL